MKPMADGVLEAGLEGAAPGSPSIHGVRESPRRLPPRASIAGRIVGCVQRRRAQCGVGKRDRTSPYNGAPNSGPPRCTPGMMDEQSALRHGRGSGIGCVRAFSLFILAPALGRDAPLRRPSSVMPAPLVGAVIRRICGVVGWSWLARAGRALGPEAGRPFRRAIIPGRSTTDPRFSSAYGRSRRGRGGGSSSRAPPPPIGRFGCRLGGPPPPDCLLSSRLPRTGHAGNAWATPRVSLKQRHGPSTRQMADAYRSVVDCARFCRSNRSYPLGPHALDAKALAQGARVGSTKAILPASRSAQLVPSSRGRRFRRAQSRRSGSAKSFVATRGWECPFLSSPATTAKDRSRRSFPSDPRPPAFAITLQRRTEMPGPRAAAKAGSRP
jgi:hypothetical protein